MVGIDEFTLDQDGVVLGEILQPNWDKRARKQPPPFQKAGAILFSMLGRGITVEPDKSYPLAEASTALSNKYQDQTHSDQYCRRDLTHTGCFAKNQNAETKCYHWNEGGKGRPCHGSQHFGGAVESLDGGDTDKNTLKSGLHQYVGQRRREYLLGQGQEIDRQEDMRPRTPFAAD